MKKLKKLSLGKETIRTLSGVDLKAAVGGVTAFDTCYTLNSCNGCGSAYCTPSVQVCTDTHYASCPFCGATAIAC